VKGGEGTHRGQAVSCRANRGQKNHRGEWAPNPAAWRPVRRRAVETEIVRGRTCPWWLPAI